MSYDRRKEDIERIDALLSAHRESLSEWELEAFTGMREGLQKYKELTSKQRAIVAACYEKLVPTYVNAVSSGVVPRGRQTAQTSWENKVTLHVVQRNLTP